MVTTPGRAEKTSAWLSRAAFQAVHDLAPGETVSCVFLLGETQARDMGARDMALELVRRYRAPGAVQAADP